MIDRMRAVTAALVGALCGAGWMLSIQPLGDVVCDGSGLGCALLVIVIGIPALAIAWMLVGWGLLAAVRLRNALLTASLGTAGMVALMFGGGYLLKALNVKVSGQGGTLLVALAAASGYALAAALTGGYGVRRDGTEHRGQDG
jgi:purine-cytosine permease-like protein